MEKNVIVLNELGQQVSLTYPKRAKGLVKSGRAEYINDCAIRLLNALEPTVLDIENMEDTSMSNVICFNSRDFQFDKTCQGKNVGSRMFITDSFGNNVEVFEIGDNAGSWTQIACEKTLEKYTDYVFRFAMTRKTYSMDDGVSQFIIVPEKESLSGDENWDNRYVYNLARNEYKPLINKNVDGKNVKVFEIPFNTGDCDKVRFVFVEQYAVTRIFEAADNEAYEKYPEADRSFFEETKSQIENWIPKDINVSQTLSDAAESLKKAVDKISTTVVSQAKAFTENHIKSEGNTRKGENINASSLQSELALMEDNSSIGFFGCNINQDSDTIDCGNTSDSILIKANGCNVCGQAFAGFVTKLGDDSVLECNGSNVSGYYGNVIHHGGPVDGTKVVLNGSNISESSLARLFSVLGDGCTVDLNGSVVEEEYGEFWYGNPSSGLVINAKESVIPEKVLNKINAKFDDGCVINK